MPSLKIFSTNTCLMFISSGESDAFLLTVKYKISCVDVRLIGRTAYFIRQWMRGLPE